MKISRPSKTGSTKASKTKTANNIGDNSFNSMVENTTKTDVATPSSAVETVSSLPEALSGKSPEYHAQTHAENILEHLEKLQMGLITGSISETALRNMADIVDHYKSNISDKALEDILNDIHLRAEVEIAKYMRDKC